MWDINQIISTYLLKSISEKLSKSVTSFLFSTSDQRRWIFLTSRFIVIFTPDYFPSLFVSDQWLALHFILAHLLNWTEKYCLRDGRAISSRWNVVIPFNASSLRIIRIQDEVNVPWSGKIRADWDSQSVFSAWLVERSTIAAIFMLLLRLDLHYVLHAHLARHWNNSYYLSTASAWNQ